MQKSSKEEFTNASTLQQSSQPTLPTLQEVLNMTAPAPYTLDSFVEFLSRNDHLQPLEFMLEARRYKTSYCGVFQQAGELQTPSQRQLQHLAILWERLVSIYILPGSQCDVKLADDALNRLQRYVDMPSVPPIEISDFTLKQVHDKMAGLIFLLFLNERTSLN
ncbi:hypothetical protein BDV37DRAFT_56431 [Aspergillus pseudonomiae]|uniref:RGS domain-containing protein n=1 Tax=Aspergillus pseudonomiae TaxID=1506151 RepID=A0A5N7CUW6_9EURO|nr:uncharacterized protein BDV37DRAFT_56431 [Aspergillus pseudonomiae]KAE8397438.1 hypothetical protein BDV37DRAFT_56431 [Aspergillus pseudonomiae]